VTHVIWTDAENFCKRASALTGRVWRLPTEAEWEYACRAGTTTSYSFGDDVLALDAHGWYFANSGDASLPLDTAWDFNKAFNSGGWGCRSHPVGQKLPNAWGLYDMHGNVWEWCADYADYTGGVVTNTYGGAVTDPLCLSGAQRVVRGGSWGGGPAGCRSALRYCDDPSLASGSLGFRPALVARPPVK
jgi:formylglycine-generating enzyme required for sulfatase activity